MPVPCIKWYLNFVFDTEYITQILQQACLYSSSETQSKNLAVWIVMSLELNVPTKKIQSMFARNRVQSESGGYHASSTSYPRQPELCVPWHQPSLDDASLQIHEATAPCPYRRPLLQALRRPLPGSPASLLHPHQTECMIHASKWIVSRPQFLNGSLRLASMNDFLSVRRFVGGGS